MNKQAGITLLNIMAALAITALTLALVVPSAQKMISRYRFESHAYDFFISLSQARSEAIKGRVNVTVCPSTDGATCAGAGDWNRGWILVDAGGGVIKVHPRLSGSTTIVAETGTSYETSITYRPSGITSSAGRLVLCYDDTTGAPNLKSGRTVTINATGAATMTKNANNLGAITTVFSACDGTI